jgi:hypothetical protein
MGNKKRKNKGKINTRIARIFKRIARKNRKARGAAEVLIILPQKTLSYSHACR